MGDVCVFIKVERGRAKERDFGAQTWSVLGINSSHHESPAVTCCSLKPVKAARQFIKPLVAAFHPDVENK